MRNCNHCGCSFDEHMSACPRCGTPNPIYRPGAYGANVPPDYKAQQGYTGNPNPNYGGAGMPYGCPSPAASNKTLVGIMALLFGGLGVQYFILGKVGAGLICILLTLVTCGLWSTLMFAQGIVILCMSEQDYQAKFVNPAKTFPVF